MEAGLPYRSSHPDAFDETGASIVTSQHPGAHDLAPHRWRADVPLQHWRAYRLDPAGVQIADGLSNLDDVVDAALRGLGR